MLRHSVTLYFTDKHSCNFVTNNKLIINVIFLPNKTFDVVNSL